VELNQTYDWFLNFDEKNRSKSLFCGWEAHFVPILIGRTVDVLPVVKFNYEQSFTNCFRLCESSSYPNHGARRDQMAGRTEPRPA
jgi:hypothetical protein